MIGMEIYHSHPKDSLPGVRSVVKRLALSEWASAFKKVSLFNRWFSAHNWARQGTGQAISAQQGTHLVDSLDPRSAHSAARQGVITPDSSTCPIPVPCLLLCSTNSGSASASQRPQPVTIKFPEFNHCYVIVPLLRQYAVKHFRVKNHDLCKFLSKDSPK